jgi:hypothetical protein
MRSVSDRSRLDHEGHDLTEMAPMFTLLLTYGLTLFIGICVGLYGAKFGIFL